MLGFDSKMMQASLQATVKRRPVNRHNWDEACATCHEVAGRPQDIPSSCSCLFSNQFTNYIAIFLKLCSIIMSYLQRLQALYKFAA